MDEGSQAPWWHDTLNTVIGKIKYILDRTRAIRTDEHKVEDQLDELFRAIPKESAITFGEDTVECTHKSTSIIVRLPDFLKKGSPLRKSLQGLLKRLRRATIYDLYDAKKAVFDSKYKPYKSTAVVPSSYNFNAREWTVEGLGRSVAVSYTEVVDGRKRVTLFEYIVLDDHVEVASVYYLESAQKLREGTEQKRRDPVSPKVWPANQGAGEYPSVYGILYAAVCIGIEVATGDSFTLVLTDSSTVSEERVKQESGWGDVVLRADGYTGPNSAKLGVFERQAADVQGRPTYKKRGKEEYLFYTTLGNWMVGSDTSKTGGWWTVSSVVSTPAAIMETWQVAAGGIKWPEVPEAKIVTRAAFEAEAAQAGHAFGDVALQADGYTGKNADRLGVFKLQKDLVQGRPTYKKDGKREFLYYTPGGSWMVGADTSKAACGWVVASGAMTPGAITETWKAHNGSAWVDVPGAKIERVEFAAHAAVEVLPSFYDVKMNALRLQFPGWYTRPISEYSTDPGKVWKWTRTDERNVGVEFKGPLFDTWLRL
jgi:hypothetical protein